MEMKLTAAVSSTTQSYLPQHPTMESAIALRFSTISISSGLHAARASKPHFPFRSSPIVTASPFLHRVGSCRGVICKANASQVDKPYSLPLRMPTPGAANIDHHLEIMEVAKKLKESRKYALAVEILKLHQPKVKNDPEAAYQVNMEIMHILSLQDKTSEALLYAEELYENKETYAKQFQFELFYSTQLMEIAMKLKKSQQYDLAVKLLKVHDPEVENNPEASYYVKMELLHILFLQEKYQEAKIYCDELDKKEPIYQPHFKSGLFYALKSGILCGLDQHDEAIGCMHKFNQNRNESIPMAPPITKH